MIVDHVIFRIFRIFQDYNRIIKDDINDAENK
jgi:hypothetical protein